MRVGGRRIVLERLVVRAVVLLQRPAHVRGRSATHRFGTTRRRHRRPEATLEPSPRDPLGIQQVADVRAQHGQLGWAATIIVEGIEIPDHAGRSDTVCQVPEGMGRIVRRGIARDQVERAGGGRAEHRAECVVVQRKVLGIVPHSSHRVAIVVAHDQRRSVAVVRAPRATHPDKLHELVHEPSIRRLLFWQIIMILVTGVILRAVQAEGIGSVGIVV